MASSPNPPEDRGGLDLPPFYPILDIDVARDRQLDPLRVLDAWLTAGVRLVQLRAKSLAGGAFLDLAGACLRRTRQAGALFIVNDRVDVAALAGADGVHLGQEDITPALARPMLPGTALVGWSTHNEGQLTGALAMPIDYVAIGPVFATASKAKPDPVVGLEGVRRAADLAAGRPLVAIGGITLSTAAEVIAAGASTVAVIGDVLVEDAAARAREFLAALDAAR